MEKKMNGSKGMEKIGNAFNDKCLKGASKKCMNAEGKSIDNNTIPTPKHELGNPSEDKKGK